MFVPRQLYILLFSVTAVLAHGTLLKPPPRIRGPEMLQNCGQQVFNKDPLGNIQDYLQTGRQQKDFSEVQCDLATCRGATFADNADSVQVYTTGQKIDVKYQIGYV